MRMRGGANKVKPGWRGKGYNTASGARSVGKIGRFYMAGV
jgi:hypothetical protein